MKTFKHWQIYETMPDGWKIDKTVGSPLSVHEFITNGKSVLNAQKRALLAVKPKADIATQNTTPRIEIEPSAVSKPNKPTQVIDRASAKAVNELARESFKLKMLNDIRVDLMICEIEGWSKLEYINQMKELINSLGRRVCVNE